MLCFNYHYPSYSCLPHLSEAARQRHNLHPSFLRFQGLLFIYHTNLYYLINSYYYFLFSYMFRSMSKYSSSHLNIFTTVTSFCTTTCKKFFNIVLKYLSDFKSRSSNCLLLTCPRKKNPKAAEERMSWNWLPNLSQVLLS